MGSSHVIVAGLLTVLSACAGQEPRILVDLRTDLVPEREFSEVESILTVAGSPAGTTIPFSVAEGMAFLDGGRIAEFADPSTGTVRIRVRLRAADGTLVAERDTAVTFDGGQLGVTVLITRDCRGVMCPAEGGDPGATECLASSCVPPECSIENPSACGANGCNADSDCLGASECSTFACVDGFCLAQPIDGACGAAEWCSPDRGCLPLSDDCVPGAMCIGGGACERGEVDCSTGAAVCRIVGPAAAGTPCRGAVDACDAPELCDGASMACPGDELAPVGTPCTDGFCNGLGTCAPCTIGAACSTGNPCQVGMTQCDTGTPVCVSSGPAAAGTPCRDSAGQCDVAETCDGASEDCPANAFEPNTTDCRLAVDLCDAPETCTGSDATCPVDSLESAGAVCRPTAMPCDEPESCDGSTLACPVDAPPLTTCSAEFRSAGTFDFVVPVGCTRLEGRMWGAGGGRGLGNSVAAAGGFAEGEMPATPGEMLTIAVGGPGTRATGGNGVPGGLHGGGQGADGLSSQAGGGGGGFVGVFRGSIAQANTLLMAGGGGGSGGGASSAAGAGGGASGQSGSGGAGTQTMGGAGVGGGTAGIALRGGNGGRQSSGDGGGGGGGGWFGGGGGTGANTDAGGGGGGSGYAAGSVIDPDLQRGNRGTPPVASDGQRMGAGSVEAPGAVLLLCL